MSKTADYRIIEAFREKGFECTFYGYGKEYDWEHFIDSPCASYVKVAQNDKEKDVHLHFSPLPVLQSKEYQDKKGRKVGCCVMWREGKRGHIDIPDDLKDLCNIQVQRLIEAQMSRLRNWEEMASIRNENY